MNYCESCFEKQRKIDRLEEEVVRLKAEVARHKAKTEDGYFGSSTPSSKKPFKESGRKEKKNGGAGQGHPGHGRRSVNHDEADRVEYHDLEDKCPNCNSKLRQKGNANRTVTEISEVKKETTLHIASKGWCPKCKKTITAPVSALPNSLYGNNLIAQASFMHFLQGIPVGRLGSLLNVEGINFFEIFHRIAEIFEPAVDRIICDYRNSEVKHADETSWRTDGDNGYSWLFCSERESIFRFEDTRSGRIPIEILGSEKLPGVLVVDRYAGYNRVPCDIQYCYAHLLRLVEDLEREFPNDCEIKSFVSTLAPLLAEAMKLRNQDISDTAYYERAMEIKKDIIVITKKPSRHMGIKNIQTIFIENKKRLYHWVKNRKIPPDNNRAERELRPTVIARKVSFGSQSKDGAKTRSILMTCLHTGKKRLKIKNVGAWLKGVLDSYALNPNIDPYILLHANPDST